MNRREKLESMLDVRGGPWLKKWEKDMDLSRAIQKTQGVNTALVRLVYEKTVKRGNVVAPIAVGTFVSGGAVGSERSFYRDMAKLNKEGVVLKFPWLVYGLKTVNYYGLGLGRILMGEKGLSMKQTIERSKERSRKVRREKRAKLEKLTVYSLVREWNGKALDEGYRKPTWTKKDAGMMKNWLGEMLESDYTEKEVLETIDLIIERWSDMRRRKRWRGIRIDPRLETPTFSAFYPLRHAIIDFIRGTTASKREEKGEQEWTWKG